MEGSMIGINQLCSTATHTRVAQPHRSVIAMALRRFAIGLPILALGAMLLWPTGLQALENQWQNNAIASATSPDGRFTAVLGTVSFGGVSMEGMTLVIHKNGSNESLAVFELTGTNAGQVQWEGN